MAANTVRIYWPSGNKVFTALCDLCESGTWFSKKKETETVFDSFPSSIVAENKCKELMKEVDDEMNRIKREKHENSLSLHRDISDELFKEIDDLDEIINLSPLHL